MEVKGSVLLRRSWWHSGIYEWHTWSRCAASSINWVYRIVIYSLITEVTVCSRTSGCQLWEYEEVAKAEIEEAESEWQGGIDWKSNFSEENVFSIARIVLTFLSFHDFSNLCNSGINPMRSLVLVSLTAEGGFNPRALARSHRSIRDTPIHGP